ncbi:MAG: hypothetical protein J5634_04285 [Bacilli bacterium]|nr:hypothetical protein [Bacilli bacterium]
MGFFENRRLNKELEEERKKEEKLYKEHYEYLCKILENIDICVNYLANKYKSSIYGTYKLKNDFQFYYNKNKDKKMTYEICTLISHACGSDYVYDRVDLFERKDNTFVFNNYYYDELIKGIDLIVQEYFKVKKYADERERNCKRLIAWYERVEDKEFVYNLKKEYQNDPDNFFYKKMGLLKARFIYVSKSNLNHANNITFDTKEVWEDCDNDYGRKQYDSAIVTYCGKILFSPSMSYVTFLDNLESFDTGWYKEYKKLYNIAIENSNGRGRTKK